MKIYSNNYQKDNYKSVRNGLSLNLPSFKNYVSSDIVTLNGSQKTVSTFTRLFRDSALFLEIPDYLRKKFPNGAKVYSYASSIGAEPYSLAISVLDKLSTSDVPKYLPILARDVSKNVIQLAKSRKLPITFDEKVFITQNVKRYKFEDFFEELPHQLSTSQSEDNLYRNRDYYVKDLLFNQVDFKQDDLFNALASPETFLEPCVVFFRNAWQFLDDKEKTKLADMLFAKLKPRSSVVIGDFLIEGNVGSRLQSSGFEKCSKSQYYLDDIIYEKP